MEWLKRSICAREWTLEAKIHRKEPTLDEIEYKQNITYAQKKKLMKME